MSLPTTASVVDQMDAPAAVVYDLVADVTNMGRWSPECRGCEWVGGEPGRVGSRFRGHNRSGVFRWTTEAKVLVAEPGREFTFATLHKGEPATRWSYLFEPTGPDGDSTTVTETFEAIRTPPLIAFAERYLIRHRQQQLVEGMRRTLAALDHAISELDHGDANGGG